MSKLLENMVDEMRNVRHKHYRFRNLNRAGDADAAITSLTNIKKMTTELIKEIRFERNVVSKHMHNLDKLLNIAAHKKNQKKPGKI